MFDEIVIGYRDALGFTVSRKTIAERESQVVGSGDTSPRSVSRMYVLLYRAVKSSGTFLRQIMAIGQLVEDCAVRALSTELKGRNADAKI